MTCKTHDLTDDELAVGIYLKADASILKGLTNFKVTWFFQQQLFPSEPSLAHFNHPGHFQFQIPIPQKLLCLLHLSKSLYLVDQFFPVCILWTWRTNQPCIFSHSMEAAHIHFLHCYRLADFACTLPWVGFLAVKKLILWQHSCTQSLQQKPYVLVLNVVKDSS